MDDTRRTKDVTRESVERSCRVYHTNTDAAGALGIGLSTLKELCGLYGIESPHERRQRKLGEAKGG